MGTATGALRADEVREAIADVRDPELDESLVKLGFVAGVDVTEEDVTIRLLVPTYFCAANFTWLMAEDLRRAAARVAGGRRVKVLLGDHFVDEEISEGVNAGARFQEAFSGLADDELDELRVHFWRKAMTARQWQVAEALRARGWSLEALGGACLGDAPPSIATSRLRELRALLGVSTAPDSPLFVKPDGRPIPVDELEIRLEFARLTSVSLETNGEYCRGLFAVRYEGGAK
jgi:metal-sulfur cluster biosynthetic enzyme